MKDKQLDIRGADKREYDRWLALCEQVRQATPVTVSEDEGEREARKAKLLKDPIQFALHYRPELIKPSKRMQYAVRRVAKDPRFFGWWMMGRGLGKDTWLDEILPLYLMAKGELRFMLLIGANHNHACMVLGNLQAQLEYNQRYVHDYGQQVRMGNWADGEFQTVDGTSFLALGMNQPVRGLNIRGARPDYIVASDVETKERTKNPARCQESYNWLMEDVLGTQPVGGKVARFVFNNNYFSKTSVGSILLQESPGLEVIQHDLIDKDGQPAEPWISAEWVAEQRQRMGYRAFMREYMNTPIEEGHVFQPEWIQWKRLPALKHYRKIVAYFDPSFSSKGTADYKAVSVWGLWREELHHIDCFVRKCPIGEAVKFMYDYYKETQGKAVVDFWMERQFYNEPFKQSVQAEGKKRGYRLPLRFDERKKGNKEQRIESMAALYEQGIVYWNETKRNNSDMQSAYDQLLAFGPGSRAHDDAPDAAEGAWHILLAFAKSDAAGLRTAPRHNAGSY